MSSRDIVVSVSGLTKYYDSFCAVNNLDFELKTGEILGFLGPNGAGKSTTIQMLLGLTTPDSGKVTYFGREFYSNRSWCLSQMNYSSTYSQLQGRLTVEQNLRVYAGLYEVPEYQKRITWLLQLLEIEHTRHKLFWHLSSGQKTRVILAKALINKPQLLLLDEPTASLDPDIVNKIIEVIRNLQREENVSIVFTSHNMEEVTRLCDRVIFMNHGVIVAEDTPVNLTKRIGNVQLEITFDASKELMTTFLEQHQLVGKFITSKMVSIGVQEEAVPQVLFDFKGSGIWVTDINIKKPTLEDVFLSIARGESDALAPS